MVKGHPRYTIIAVKQGSKVLFHIAVLTVVHLEAISVRSHSFDVSLRTVIVRAAALEARPRATDTERISFIVRCKVVTAEVAGWRNAPQAQLPFYPSPQTDVIPEYVDEGLRELAETNWMTHPLSVRLFDCLVSQLKLTSSAVSPVRSIIETGSPGNARVHPDHLCAADTALKPKFSSSRWKSSVCAREHALQDVPQQLLATV